MNPPGGTITIAGKTVSRLGLGTMRLPGRDSWGNLNAGRAKAMRLLGEAVRAHGITHIDTADAYGPHSVEDLIRDVLAPYWFDTDVLIATKVGMIRPGPTTWKPLGRPEYLRAAVEGSLRRLGVERLDLCYLHRNDPTVPFVEQVGALAELHAEGKIAHIGLSKVTPDEIYTALSVTPIAAVQNKLNLDLQDDLETIEHCRDLGIPYVAYAPLGAGALAVQENRAKALRWLLDLGPHVAPIPGTASLPHLHQLIKSIQT
ncbi:aldo/keto reductase [Streptomyces sp. NPDC056401]|uniref:aldo/keto reductase n=1 Tax=Streptomyces sp. NPDC056401 TaxID=3345809 RepID=UPI0035D86BB0